MYQRTSARPGSERPGVSFAGFRLEADGTLLRGETPVHLPPKELAALRLLLANAGRIVTTQQLRQALWGEVHVTPDSVPRCVSSLRARLEPEECIQTVYKRGYRFTPEVLACVAGAGKTPPRIAILPFATEYGVPVHLGSALAEETMVRLSNARPAMVAVLAQDSVFTLARRGLTAQEIGETLRADMVLTGTLRALPAHYRLRAEMVRISDGTQVWVEDVLVERNRIGGLEGELINRLAFRINHEAPGDGSPQQAKFASREGEDRQPAGSSTKMGWTREELSISAAADREVESSEDQREAWEIFQSAHHEWQTLERHRMQDGLQHLLRASELDPSLTVARVDLVNLCVTQGFYGFMPPAVEADMVRRAAESIPDLSDRAEAILPALGWVRFHVDRDLPAALRAFSLSAHLPHDPWVTRVRSMFALSRRRFGEAIEILRAAMHLDPYSAWLQARLAWALHLAGEADKSVEQIRLARALFPEHEGINLYGAMILAFNGDAARGVELALELAQRLPYFDLATAVHAYALACAGQGDEARTILERLQWLSRERFLMKSFTPAVYVALGDAEAALGELRISDENRCPWFFPMLADPRLKALEGRPEFEQMQAILDGMEADAARGADAQ